MKKVVNYKLVSDLQWRNLHRKINGLNDKLDAFQEQLPNKPKRFLKFWEAVPPASVCKDIMSMLDGMNTYEGFIGRLSEYYGCETMGIYISKRISPECLAEYRPATKSAYTKEKIVSEHTVLHEFFHHLQHQNVVVVDKKDQEIYAEKYAKIFLERAERS